MAPLSDMLAQFDIVERVCVRGRSLFLERGDNEAIDMFEHMETEIKRLRLMVEQWYD